MYVLTNIHKTPAYYTLTSVEYIKLLSFLFKTSCVLSLLHKSNI